MSLPFTYVNLVVHALPTYMAKSRIIILVHPVRNVDRLQQITMLCFLSLCIVSLGRAKSIDARQIALFTYMDWVSPHHLMTMWPQRLLWVGEDILTTQPANLWVFLLLYTCQRVCSSHSCFIFILSRCIFFFCIIKNVICKQPT